MSAGFNGPSLFSRALARLSPARTRRTYEQDDGAGYERSGYVSGKRPAFFDKDLKDAVKCRRMYEQGGMVGEAIDAYALFVFAQGYGLEGAEGATRSRVQTLLDKVNIEMLMRQMITDALVIPGGRGYAEIVWNRARSEVVDLMYRPAETIMPIYDERGRIALYQQTVVRDGSTITVELPKEDMFVLDLHMELVKRAFKDIEIDAIVADATATAIQRHGYPRYHIRMGQAGEKVPDTVLESHGQEFEELRPDMEWTTTHDVEILNIDSAGVLQAQQYNNLFSQRLAAALGVPEEMLGLGRGSTEATANVRLENFKFKVAAIQRMSASELSTQVLDLITGAPGVVWFRFNEVSLDEMLKKAEIVAKLTGANSFDPHAIASPEWCQEFMGIQPEGQ